MLRPSEVVDSARSASQIYQLVSEFSVPIGLGVLADWQFGSLPWGILIGTAMGVFLGIIRIRSILKRLEQQDRLQKDQKGQEQTRKDSDL